MFVRARITATVVIAALGLVLGGGGAARAQQRPAGQAVKWDQARVTQYAKELHQAVTDAVQAVREDPSQVALQQRQVWYDLKEDLRLLENAAGRLEASLQNGDGAEQTRATFDRIESLRHDAEESGRKAVIPAPVMEALVKAGSIHNRMRPYYLGKT